MDDRAVMTAADFGAPTPDADPIAETAVVTPEDFGAAAPVDYFTQWIGPRPKSDLRSLNNGSDYIRLQDMNIRGRAGFMEGITPDETSIPFAGSVLDATRIGKLVFTAKKLTNGEEVDDQSLLDMNLFLAESDREANAKWTGKLGRGLKDLVTFGSEIAGTALAVGSVGGAVPGLAAEAQALAGKAAVKMGKIELRQYIFKAMQKRVERGMTGVLESATGKVVAKRLGASATKEAVEKEAAQKVADSFLAKTAAGLAGIAAAGGATAGVKVGTQLVGTGGETAGANERQLMATLTGKPESYTTSLMYDMGDTFIEYMTEYSGAKMAGAVSDVAGKFGAKIPGRDFGKRMLDKLERTIGLDFVNKNRGLAPAVAARGAAATVDKMKWLAATGAYVGAIATREGVNVETAIRLAKSAGYDGIAEEWAEERLGGFLRGLTGIEGDEAGLRNAVDKMIPSLEDGLVEIATFATPIALITGLHGLQASKWAGGPGLDQLSRDTNRMISLLKKQDNPTESASSAERDELTNLIEKHTKFYNSASNKTMAGKVLKLVEDISTLNFSGTEFGNLDRALGAANIQPVIKMWAEAREATIKSFQSAKPDLKLDQAEAQVDKLLRPYVRRFADSWRQTLSARALPGITEEEANTELQKAVTEGTVKFIKVGDNRIAVAESENLSSASDKMISVLKDLNVLLLQRGQSPLSMPTLSVNMSAEEYLNATSDMTSEENFDLMVRLNFGRLGSDNTWKQWRSVVKDTRGVAEKIDAGLPVVGMTVGLVDNPDQPLPTSFAKVTQVLEDGKVVLDQGMAANETFVSPRNYRISEGIELEFGRGSLSMGTRAELVKKYEEYTDGNDANFSLLYAREVSDDKGGKMKNAKGEQLYIVTNQGLSSFNRMFISLENRTSYDMVEELLHTGANLQSAAKNYGAKGAMSPLANQVVDQANAWFRAKLTELDAKGVRKLSEVERDLYDQVKAAVIATNPGSKARREFYHKMVGLKFAGFENDPRGLEVQWSGAIKALPVTAIQAPLVAQDLKGMFGPDYAQLFSRDGFTMSIPEHQADGTRSGTQQPPTAPVSTRSGTPAADSTLSGFPGSKPPAPTGPDSTLSGFPAAPSVGADINPVPEQPRQDKFMGGPEQPLRLPTAEELDARLKSKFTARPERLNREELESALSDALEEVFPTEDAQTEIEEDSTDGDTAMNDAANADAFARQQKSQFAPTVEAVGRRIQELNGGSALPVDAASSLTVVLQDLQPVLDPILMGTMPLDQQTEQLKAVLNDYRELGPESAMADLLHNAVISTLASQLQDGKMTIRGEGDKPAVTQLYNYYAGFQVMPAVTITIDENGAPRSSYIKNLTDPENGVVSFIHSRLDRMIDAEGGALALVEKFKKVLNASWSNTSGALDVSQARWESAAVVLRDLIGLPDHVFNNVLRPQPGGRTALTGFVFGAGINTFKQLGNRAPGMLDASVIQAADKEAATAEFLHTQLVDKMAEPGKNNAFSFIREMVSKTTYDALSLALRHKSEADSASQKDNIQRAVMLQGVQRLAEKVGPKATISSMLMKLADVKNDAGSVLNGTQAVLYPPALARIEEFMQTKFRNQDGTFGGWTSLPTFGENEQVYFVRTGLLPLDQAKAEYEAFYAKASPKIKSILQDPASVKDERIYRQFVVSQNMFGSLENFKGLEDYFKRAKQLSTPGLGFNRDLNVYIDASKKWGKKFDGQWIFFPRAAQDFANFFHGGKFTGHMKAHIYDVQPGGPTRLIKVNGMNLTVLAPETGMQGLPEGETWDGVMAVPASLVDDPEMEDRGEFFRSLYKIAQTNPNLDGIVFGDSGQKLGEKKFGAALQENGSLAGDLPNQIAAGMTVIPQKSFVMSQDLSDDTTPRMDRFARQGFFNQFGLPQSGLRVQLFNEMQDEMDKSFGFSLLDDTILKQKAEGGDASALRLVELLNAGVSPNSMGLVDKVQQRRMSMLNRLMEHASYRVRSVLSGNGGAVALTSMEIVDGKVKLGTMNSSSPGRYALRYASREAAIAAIQAQPGWFVDMIDGLDLSQPVDWKTFQWSDKLSIREHEFREMVGFDENNKVMTYTVLPGEYNLTDRIPGDFMQSHVPLRLWVQLDPRMNVAMSDDLSQIRKGEDFDGDTMYQNMLVRLADGTTPADDSRWGKYNRILLSILQDLNPETAFAFQTEAEKFKEGWISALEAGNPELLTKSEKLKMFTFDTEHFFRNAYISGRKVLGVVARFNNMIGMFPELDVSFASDIKFGDTVLSLRPGTVTKDYQHLARFKQWVGTGLVNVAVDDPKKPRLYLAGLTGDSIGLMQAYLLGRWSSFATDAGAKQAVQDAVKFMRSPMVQRYVALSAQADFRNPMVARAMNREDVWAMLAKEGFDDKSLKSLVDVKDALRDLSAVVVLATPGNKFADVRAMQKMQAKLAAFGENTSGPLNLGKFSPEAKAIQAMASRFMGQAENIFKADISHTQMFANAENWASSWYGADKGLTLPDRAPVSSRAFSLMHSRAKQAVLIQSLYDKAFMVPTDDAAARSILAAVKASSPANKFTKALAMAPGQPKFIVPEVRTDYLNDAFVKEMRAAFAQLTPRVQQYLGFLAAVWYGNNEGTRLGNYSVLFDDKFQKVRSDAQERIRRAWATENREVPVTLFDFLTLRSMPAYWPGATAEDHSRLLALNSSAAQAEKRTKLLGAVTRMDRQTKKMKDSDAKDAAKVLLAEVQAALKATSANSHPGTAKISPVQIAAMLDAAVNPERLAAEAQPGPQSRIEPPPVSLAPTSQLKFAVTDIFARLPKRLQNVIDDFGIWPAGDVLGNDEADATAKAAAIVRDSAIDEATKAEILKEFGVAPVATPSAPLRLFTGTRPAAAAGALPLSISFNVDAEGNVSNLKGIVIKGFKKWSPEVQKSWESNGWTIRESKADASIGQFAAGLALAGALAVGTPSVYAQEDSIDIGAVRDTISSNEVAPEGSSKRLHPHMDVGFDGSSQWAIGPGVRLTPENWTLLEPILGGKLADWRDPKKTITEEQLAKITTLAAMKASQFANENIPAYGEMDPLAQAAIADLIHWSIYPNKFPKSWEAMKRGDVREAVRQLQLNKAGTGPSKAMLDPRQAPRLQRAIDGLGGQIEVLPADSPKADASIGPRIDDMKAAYPGQTTEWHDLAAKLPSNPVTARQLAQVLDPSRTEQELNELVAAAVRVPRTADQPVAAEVVKIEDGGMRAYLNGRFRATVGKTNYDLSTLAVAIKKRKMRKDQLTGLEAQDAQRELQAVLNNVFQIGSPERQAEAIISFTNSVAKLAPGLTKPMATLRAHIAQFLIERDHGWVPGELWVATDLQDRLNPAIQEDINRTSASIAGFSSQEDLFSDPFIHGGNLSMHQALLNGMREINALKQEAVRYVMMKKKLYGIGPDNKVFQVEDAEGFDLANDIAEVRGHAKKYRRFLDDRIGGLFKKGKRVLKATLTEDQAFDVQLFMDASGAMLENLNTPGLSEEQAIANSKIPVQKNVLPARLHSLVRQQPRPQTEDEILLNAPKPPPAEYLAASDLMDLWRQSDARKILADAGRTEQELDPVALAREMREKFNATRDQVNQVLATTFRDQPYLKYRLNYMPHVFGNGLMGPEVRKIELELEAATRGAEAQEVKAWETQLRYSFEKNVTVMRDPVPEQIYEVLKRARYRDLKALSPTDPQLVARMQAGEFAKFGLEPGFTYANVSLHLKRLVENELISTALGRKPWQDPSTAATPVPVSELNKSDIALLHHLRTAVGNFKAKEYSNRAYARSYDTYMDAWLDRYWLPKSMSPVDTYHRYAVDVYTTALNKSLISKFLLQRDADGMPLVVPRVSRVYREEGVVPKEVWREVLKNLSTAYGKPVDLNGDVGAQINAIIDEFIEPKKGRDWTEVESPFASVVKFHVQKTGGGILENIVGGETAGILKHLTENKAQWFVGDYDVLKGLMHANAWMKSNSVGFSLFFPFSTGESVIAGTGLKKNILYYNTKTGYSAPFGRAFKENIREMLQLREMMRNNAPQMSEFANFMERTGLSFDFANVSEGVVGTVEKDIEAMAKRVELAMGAKAAENFKKVLGANNQWSRTLFGDLFPTIKVWATHRIFMQMKSENANVSDTEIMKAIAPMMDAAYGGIEWERFAWATPRVIQALNLSLFAPIWTFAAWNIAGGGLLTGRVLKNYMSPQFKKFVFTQNWPAMMALVLFGIPNAIQFAMWAAMGGDPDDTPFASLNEEGKGGVFPSIDLTPLVRRMPNYTGEQTGKRRVYARFGKQSFEVIDGWLKEPLNTLLRKLSQPAKLVFEQVTGTSPGSEWNLEFRGRGMLGWVEDKNGDFLGSRAGYAVQKFLPMSIVQAVKNPATVPFNFVVPTSKGMSLGTASHMLEQIMWTYANEDTWSLVKVNPEYKTRLASLAPEVLDAASRNGVNADKVIATAKGAVLGKLYGEFYKALNENDLKAMERISYRILRVNGSLDGIQRSVTNRDKQYGRTDSRTPEQQEAIEAAFK